MKNRLFTLFLSVILTVTGVAIGGANNQVVCGEAEVVSLAGSESQALPDKAIYDFVDRMYRNFLNREPDMEGRLGWADKLADKDIDGATFAYGFAHSPEFEVIYNSISSEEFVTRLYHTFLDREPDTEGFAFWVKLADNWMPLDYMVGGFANSQEFKEACKNAHIVQGDYPTPDVRATELNGKAIGDFVERFYVEALGRASEPAGKRHWSTKIATGEIVPADLVYGFMESLEFTNRAAGMTNEEYVDCMYHTFFNRVPDEDGFAFWVDSLADGTRVRHDIIDGFVESQEYLDMVEGFFSDGTDDDGDDDTDVPTDFNEMTFEQQVQNADRVVYQENGDVYCIFLDRVFLDLVNDVRVNTYGTEPLGWLECAEPWALMRAEQIYSDCNHCPSDDVLFLSEAIGMTTAVPCSLGHLKNYATEVYEQTPGNFVPCGHYAGLTLRNTDVVVATGVVWRHYDEGSVEYQKDPDSYRIYKSYNVCLLANADWWKYYYPVYF